MVMVVVMVIVVVTVMVVYRKNESELYANHLFFFPHPLRDYISRAIVSLYLSARARNSAKRRLAIIPRPNL